MRQFDIAPTSGGALDEEMIAGTISDDFDGYYQALTQDLRSIGFSFSDRLSFPYKTQLYPHHRIVARISSSRPDRHMEIGSSQDPDKLQTDFAKLLSSVSRGRLSHGIRHRQACMWAELQYTKLFRDLARKDVNPVLLFANESLSSVVKVDSKGQRDYVETTMMGVGEWTEDGLVEPGVIAEPSSKEMSQVLGAIYRDTGKSSFKIVHIEDIAEVMRELNLGQASLRSIRLTGLVDPMAREAFSICYSGKHVMPFEDGVDIVRERLGSLKDPSRYRYSSDEIKALAIKSI